MAAAQGDAAGALRHAQAAYGLARTARWAWRALLESKLEAGDWEAALELVRGALDRKIVSPIVAERARAALLAASAARLETSSEPKARAQALDRAAEAAKLQPGFAPGVVMASRLLAADGKAGRAAALIEAAWKAAPHPALWLAYRDLRGDETKAARARRLADLADLNPLHRESRVLAVEAALIAGDPAGARQAAQAIADGPATARTAGLMARVALAAGAPDEARLWMARASEAPQEPDWSDLDPEGRAFAYQPADWARLVAAYAETGELVHPRLDRREKTMSGLPELPVSYAESTPFRSAVGVEPVLYPAAETVYGEDEPPEGPPSPGLPRAAPRRRRLASGSRAAK